ncbi:LppA family lipoprotein [Amycolatopsis lurida]
MRFTTKAWTAAMMAGLAFATACSSPDYIEPNPPSEAPVNPDQQFNQLMQRPSLEEVVTRYDEMRGKIKERLRVELSLPEWRDEDDTRSYGCESEYPEVDSHDARRNKFANSITAQNVTAEQWQTAKMVLGQVGAEYGFTKPGLDIAKPPYFDVKLTDQYNAELSIATNTQTVLALTTGCHLLADVKQRGTPAAKPTY